MSNDLEALAVMWQKRKDVEAEAQRERREIEDRIVAILNNPQETSGVKKVAKSLKVTYNLRETIDANKLQEVAEAAGLRDELGMVFRWKPEINKREWKAADKSIINVFSKAITRKPGRPTFQSVEKDKDNE